MLALPGSADAACGVAQSRAEYETPEVQIYQRKAGLYACLRATGKERLVGSRYDDGGTAEWDYFGGIYGGRYVETSFSGSYSESSDAGDETMTDLRTGKHVKVVTSDENTFPEDVEVVVTGGILVAKADEGGVIAYYTDGRKVTLSTDATAKALAATSGGRVYWQASGTVQTAVLELPPSDPARTGPRLRTIGKCKPRSGARLLEADGPMVLSRVGTNVYVCRAGTTRKVGAVTAASLAGNRYVSYVRAGLTGSFDAAKGTRRELGGEVAISSPSLIGAGPDGLTLWPDVSLAPGPASAPAFGPKRVVYWLDGAQAPQMRVLTG